MKEIYMEKRKDKRVQINNEAKFRIISEENPETISYEYKKALTKNISKGGVCLILNQKITEGNVVRVELPVDKGKIIKAFCEVEWCREQNSNGYYEVGLSFIALKEEDSQIIDEFIKKVDERAV